MMGCNVRQMIKLSPRLSFNRLDQLHPREAYQVLHVPPATSATPDSIILLSHGISTVSSCAAECSSVTLSARRGMKLGLQYENFYDTSVQALHRDTWNKLTPFACRGLLTTTYKESMQQSTSPGSDDVAVPHVHTDGVKETKGTLQSGSGMTEEYWDIPQKTFHREDGSEWPWHSFRPGDAYHADVSIDLKKHHQPATFGDRFAYYLVKSMRIPTDLFFQKRYGCRAMMLETVAAVPGMVAGMLLHLQSLRRFEHTGGWIRSLLEEAENERMHLMTFMEVAKPAWYERMLVLAVQGVFFNMYFLIYILHPRMAHRVVGYLEEEAIHSYTEFLKEIDAGRIQNVAAPQIAIDYWRLPKDATLRDVVLVVRADEAHHRDVNHLASNVLKSGKKLKDKPAPKDYH